MIQKLKTMIASVAAMLVLAVPLAVPVAAQGGPTTPGAAGTPDISNKLCSGAQDLQFGGSSNCATATTSESDFNHFLTTIINIFSVIVGVIAVIMIIIGGFRYVTSGGDSTKVTGAKNTIMYALIGLIIVALAQLIVKFVLNKAANGAV